MSRDGLPSHITIEAVCVPVPLRLTDTGPGYELLLECIEHAQSAALPMETSNP